MEVIVMKKFKGLMCVLFIISITMSTSAFAFDSDYGMVLDQASSDLSLSIVDIKISKNTVVIESNGYSEFIDVIATMSDDSTLNINEDAIWTVDDQNVAIAIPE